MAKFTAQAGIDPLLRVDLDPGDEVAAERGSMVMMDAGLVLNLWTTHPLSSGLPLFLIPELRAVSGNLRQPEVKCFAYK